MITVKNIMRSDFARISPNATIMDVAKKMIQNKVETIFIIDEEQVVGVIGLRDLFTLPIPAIYGGPMHRQKEEELIQHWKDTPLAHLMNTHVISVPEDYPMMYAAERMVNEGIHPLAIMHGKRLVGIVDRIDILQALLQLDTANQVESHELEKDL